jgi:hypothetical protein
LNSRTVRHSLVGVDTLGRLLAVEVLFEELLDFWDTSGTSNKDDLLSALSSKYSRRQSRPSLPLHPS